jgi:hypothetical protein
VTGEDQDVLEFIGRQGKAPEEIRERFPDFDVMRLVRAGLAEERSIELAETQAHIYPSPAWITYYVLTKRGAEAVGIDPTTLHAASPGLGNPEPGRGHGSPPPTLGE